jgi:hypothetical protein
MNSWVLGISTSLIAAAISYIITSYWERRRELNRIYDVLAPVIQELAAMRRQQLISGDSVQKIVRSLSTSVGSVYAGGSDQLRKYRHEKLIGMIRPECGVCGKPPEVDGTACALCKLNCCAWNFAG